MNRIGHILLGFMFGAVFIWLMNASLGWFPLLSWKTYAFAIPVILLYSLLPDIDIESGTITWFFLGMGILGAVIGVFFNQALLYFSLALLVMTFVTVKITHHRGIIHSMWFAVLFAIPMYFIIGLEYSFLAFIAFYSHLLGDGFLFKLR